MKPKLDEIFENHCNWQVWRAICDRIISHPDYRFDSPRKYPLLKMAHFACEQMGKYNLLQWGSSSVFLPGDLYRMRIRTKGLARYFRPMSYRVVCSNGLTRAPFDSQVSLEQDF